MSDKIVWDMKNPGWGEGCTFWYGHTEDAVYAVGESKVNEGLGTYYHVRRNNHTIAMNLFTKEEAFAAAEEYHNSFSSEDF